MPFDLFPPMNRRFFLEGIGYITLGSLLTSCGNSPSDRFNIQILRRSLPVQLLKNVTKELNPKIEVKVGTQNSVAEIFGKLQTWKRNPRKASINEVRLAGLGDYWLPQAITEELISPLKLQPETLQALPPKWRSLIQRDKQGQPSNEGEIWGAPYRWGATILVYRKDKLKDFDWKLTDWSDLWRPELEGRVGLLNQPREVIGMVQKYLGQSYNEPDPQSTPELLDSLQQLNQQTKFYASQNYIQALMLGDTWVSMGWSSDVLPALKQDDKLGVVVPKSGTSIWSDLWVNASLEQVSDDFPVNDLMNQWVEYWWSPTIAYDVSRFTNASSVIPTDQFTDEPNQSQKLLSPENLEKSEFLAPLTKVGNDQYKKLWIDMRSR